MKIYRVHTGWETDHYGAHFETARYFLDKDKALEFYKTGERTIKRTKITEYLNGKTYIRYTGASFYEEYLHKAKSYEVIELVDEIENFYFFEEIEAE